MRTICELDAAGIFTGRSSRIGEADGCPVGWVRADAPIVAEDMVARWAGESWIIIDPLPPTSDPVPNEVSDRQFFQQLALEGVITQDEALEAVSVGILPAALSGALAQIPDQTERFNAVITLVGATIYKRSHPLTALLGQILGKNGPALDLLWRRAFAL